MFLVISPIAKAINIDTATTMFDNDAGNLVVNINNESFVIYDFNLVALVEHLLTNKVHVIREWKNINHLPETK